MTIALRDFAARVFAGSLVLSLCLVFPTQAQQWSQKVITTNADGAQSVYAEDLDGDGDSDVLSASTADGKIAWYENLGEGHFPTRRSSRRTLTGPGRSTRRT